MLQQHVESMRRTVFRLTMQAVPPATVLILQEQAEFIGVPTTKRPKSEEEEHERSVIKSLPRGKPYGKLVCVKLEHLYLAIKDAKGVNHPDYQPRKTESETANYS